ncbi:hypothetical protein FOA52_011398 [Chlamydomonas sp. UWO 241]|nr:hypothetical protein FOA52_011398 [Chlamydomonas sp. UWO 241]
MLAPSGSVRVAPQPAMTLLGGALVSPALWEAALAQQQRQEALAGRSCGMGVHGTEHTGEQQPRASGMPASTVWAADDTHSGIPPMTSLPSAEHGVDGVGEGASPLQPSIDTPGVDVPLLECKRKGLGQTWQPSRRKRVNSHGVEKRLSTPGGRSTLMRRLLTQKRTRLTVDCFV